MPADTGGWRCGRLPWRDVEVLMLETEVVLATEAEWARRAESSRVRRFTYWASIFIVWFQFAETWEFVDNSLEI